MAIVSSSSLKRLPFRAAAIFLLASAGLAHGQSSAYISYEPDSYRNRIAYERAMEQFCGYSQDRLESAVFGPPDQYRDLNPQLGALSGEIDAAVGISAGARSSIRALFLDVKEKKDRAAFGIQASKRAENYASQKIAGVGEVVPDYSRRQNRVFRAEEEKILRHQTQRGLSEAMAILQGSQNMRHLEGCRFWWEYEREHGGPISSHFR